MTTLKQKHTIMRWVYALRSGRYEQGTGVLQRDGQYCCLGVLAEVCAVPSDDYQTDDYPTDDSNYEYWFAQGNTWERETPPAEWYRNAVGEHAPDVDDLIHYNDSVGRDFNWIADKIERTIK